MVTNTKNSNVIAFSLRLNQLLDKLDYPPKNQGRQAALAKKFEVSQKGARKWLEAESLPRTSRMIEMAEIFGVSYEWLATGKGEAVRGMNAVPRIPVLNASQAREFIDFRTYPAEYETIPSVDIATGKTSFGYAEESQQFEPAISKGAVYCIYPYEKGAKPKPNIMHACWVDDHIIVGRLKLLTLGKIALYMPDRSDLVLENGLSQVIGPVVYIHNP